MKRKNARKSVLSLALAMYLTIFVLSPMSYAAGYNLYTSQPYDLPLVGEWSDGEKTAGETPEPEEEYDSDIGLNTDFDEKDMENESNDDSEDVAEENNSDGSYENEQEYDENIVGDSSASSEEEKIQEIETEIADVEDEGIVPFEFGDGTDSSPYQIKNSDDLFLMAELINDTENPQWEHYAGASYVLAGSIDMSNHSWEPMGGGIGYGFSGVFDGAGYEISNLYIYGGNSDGYTNYGLFSDLTGGTVKNLGLVDLDIQMASSVTNAAVGGISGAGSYSSIENCYVTGRIDARNSIAGGIIGSVNVLQNDYKIVVNSCFVNVDLSGGDRLGGIAGHLVRGAALENCVSAGTITGASFVGGIAGLVNHSGYGTIKNCYSTAKVEGYMNAGGIAGDIQSSEVDNLAALNEYVNSSKNFSRVFGSVTAGRMSESVWAWEDMLLNGVSFRDKAEFFYDGNNASVEQIMDGTIWSDAFENAPWSYGRGEGELPVLAGMKHVMPSQVPSYISGEEDPELPGDGKLKGNGSRENPYQIASKDDLLYAAEKINSVSLEEDDQNRIPYASASYILKTNINLAQTAWLPIGSNEVPFTGTFDGGGYFVTGLNAASSTDSTGLFGYIEGAEVRRLGIIESSVSASGWGASGLLAGEAAGGSLIENCYVSGTVFSASGSSGGIVGYASSSELKNCVSYGIVTSSAADAGGVVGTMSACRISCCYSTASVTTSAGHAGGIAGRYQGQAEDVYGCIALNQYVTGGAGAGRVMGSSEIEEGKSSILNYAWEGLTLTGNQKEGESFENGKDVSARTLYTDISFWPEEYGYLPWSFTIGKLPVLSVLSGIMERNFPSYIKVEHDGDFTGDGTPDSPFLIYTEEDLFTAASKINEEDDSYRYAYYQLGSSIEVKGEWTPIGNVRSKGFAGHFDGNGFTIYGIQVDKSEDGAGLFGYVEGRNAQIIGLGLENADISGGLYTGGIAGFVRSGVLISDCYVTGKITGTSNVGGIAGYVSGSSRVTECYFSGDVKGLNGNAGGIIGNLLESSSAYDLHSSGSVAAMGLGSAGGIVGYLNSGLLFNCYSRAAVESERNAGGITGGVISGGLTGYVYISNTVAINPSVTGGGEAHRIGSFSSSGYITAQKNYGWEGVIVNGKVKSDNNPFEQEGGMIKASELMSTDGWDREFKSNPWQYVSGLLPTLVNVGGTQNSSWGGEDLGGSEPTGSGTKENPYVITSHEQFMTAAGWLAETAAYEMGEKEAAEFRKAYYLLAVDIDLADEEWIPLKGFEGNFDGLGNTIKNMEIKRGDDEETGFFASVISGEVKNLHLADVNIEGVNYTGGIAGRLMEGAVLENCSVSGIISGENWVGGFAGESQGTLRDVVNAAEIKGGEQVGGIAGETGEDSIVSNAGNTGLVTGGCNVGGIAGLTTGVIEKSYNQEAVSGAINTGGIAGRAENASIFRCYNNGAIEGGSQVGGIVGAAFDETTIADVYSIGDVLGKGNQVGGIAGVNSGTLQSAYAVGNTAGFDEIGGIVGAVKAGGVVNKTAALSSAVSGEGENIGRVAGKVSSKEGSGSDTGRKTDISGNQAWEELFVNGSIVSDSDLNGTGKTAIEFLVQDNWKSLLGSSESIWIYDNYKLPLLEDVGGIQADEWTVGNIYKPAGDGTADLPYLIESIENLEWMQYFTTKGSGAENSAHYKLMTDLNFSELYGEDRSWTPMGLITRPFNGTFDGGSHVITGLTINSSSVGVGFFGFMGGTVKNLGLEDADITGAYYTGGIAGNAPATSNAVIENCYVTGTVTGTTQVGGLVGNFNAGGTGAGIYESYSLADVKGNQMVGGIAGVSSSVIRNCFSDGIVSGSSSIGGIVGNANPNSTVTGCYTTSLVEGTASTGGIAGSYNGSGMSSNMALNPAIHGSGAASSARVFGTMGTLAAAPESNYAWLEMTVNDESVFSSSYNGTGISHRTIKSDYGWPGNFKTSHWNYETGMLPTLRNTGGPQTGELPEHIQNDSSLYTGTLIFEFSDGQAAFIVTDLSGDDVEADETSERPHVFKLTAGDPYRYKASADGYKDLEGTIIIDAYETVLEIELQKVEIENTYHFSLTDPGTIFVLMDKNGKTVEPDDTSHYFSYTLIVGEQYFYVASLEGYKTKRGTITVPPAIIVIVDIIRLDPIAEGEREITIEVTPEHAQLQLADLEGTLIKPDYENTYWLMSGMTYSYKVEAEGYYPAWGEIQVTEETASNIKIELEELEYTTLVFEIIPENADAVISVLDAGENRVEPNEDGSYTVIAGYDYKYQVSADGYETVERTITAAKDMEVVLIELQKLIKEIQVTFEITPAYGTIQLEDQDGDVISPESGTTYLLLLGETYSYKVEAEGYNPVSNEITISEDTPEIMHIILEPTSVEPEYVRIRFAIVPESAAAEILVAAKDGSAVNPEEDGSYLLTVGEQYHYQISAAGYKTVAGEITADAGLETISIELMRESGSSSSSSRRKNSSAAQTEENIIDTEETLEYRDDRSTDAAATISDLRDVEESSWYYESVKFAIENGLMYGTSDTAFEPSKEVTREMFVTILHRMAGAPAVSNTQVAFDDVPIDAWYSAAVLWASQQGIVSGYGNNRFGVSDVVTREQLVVMLYNYTGGSGDEQGAASITSFNDADQISSWAGDAVAWAVGTGLLTGTEQNVLNPRGTASRAETAAIMQRIMVQMQ